MGWAARLDASPKAAERLIHLRRWTAHLSDDRLKAAALNDPKLAALVRELRPDAQ